MFTGIIESIGIIDSVSDKGNNRTFDIISDLASELKVDQSLSHNGVCLTVEEVDPGDERYRVTAISETLNKTNLGMLRKGDPVNLERSVTLEKRLDGHMVQGHVDEVASCLRSEDQEGSTLFSFSLNPAKRHLIVPRGSITLDGVSLTVARLNDDEFSVAIIPYTLEHTIIHNWAPGSDVNVEYDIFGKYLERYLDVYNRDRKAAEVFPNIF